MPSVTNADRVSRLNFKEKTKSMEQSKKRTYDFDVVPNITKHRHAPKTSSNVFVPKSDS